MYALKTKIINEIIEKEIITKDDGTIIHYTKDLDDSGGGTAWGVIERTARRFGYTGRMPDLTREQAFEILSKKFWDRVLADKILAMSEAVASEVVDTGVNMGTRRAVRFLQRCLNVLNNRGKRYADIIADGKMGPATLSALAHFLSTRNEDVLLKMLNSLQGAFYVELAERREKDEKFVYGWFLNRVL